MEPIRVRRATVGDVDAIADTLAAAFLDYEWSVWAVPADDRLGRLRTLHRLDAESVVGSGGEIWVTDDLSSVAGWIPPEGVRLSPDVLERLATASAEQFGDRAAAVDALDEATRRLRPREAHWYLATLGTRPDRSGLGLATAVLRPVLERCDEREELAAVETSSTATSSSTAGSASRSPARSSPPTAGSRSG